MSFLKRKNHIFPRKGKSTFSGDILSVQAVHLTQMDFLCQKLLSLKQEMKSFERFKLKSLSIRMFSTIFS